MCAIEVLEHIPDDEIATFLSSSVACVEQGGLFLISVPTTNVAVNKKHFRHYDRDLLTSHLGSTLSGFAIESMEYYYVPTFAERLYKRITRVLLDHGDIRMLRGFVWRHVQKRADRATDANGTHLIARLRRR